MLHVLHNHLLADSLLNAMLSLNIKWVSVERCNLVLPVKFGLLCAIAELLQELCEMCGVGLSDGGYFRLCPSTFLSVQVWNQLVLLVGHTSMEMRNCLNELT